jgi:hypothetical protein
MDEFNQERVWAARVVRVGDVYTVYSPRVEELPCDPFTP